MGSFQPCSMYSIYGGAMLLHNKGSAVEGFAGPLTKGNTSAPSPIKGHAVLLQNSGLLGHAYANP